jgi:hypothetical protein
MLWLQGVLKTLLVAYIENRMKKLMKTLEKGEKISKANFEVDQ